MVNCMICKKSVATGYVVCDNCAGEPLALSYFIDRLAEDVVLEGPGSTCDMCVVGGCSSPVSDMTCRNGVKTWLLNKAKAYAGDMPVREEQYFSFLDYCFDSGCDTTQAKRRLEQKFPCLKRSAGGADALIGAWRARKRIA